MSDNEKDARYMLENMVRDVIMVMGKGREWGGDDGVRRILYVGDLDFKANGNEVGRLARHTIALSYKMTNGEQRENGNCCRQGRRLFILCFKGHKSLWRITAYRPNLLLFFLF